MPTSAAFVVPPATTIRPRTSPPRMPSFPAMRLPTNLLPRALASSPFAAALSTGVLLGSCRRIVAKLASAQLALPWWDVRGRGVGALLTHRVQRHLRLLSLQQNRQQAHQQLHPQICPPSPQARQEWGTVPMTPERSAWPRANASAGPLELPPPLTSRATPSCIIKNLT